MHPNMKTIAIVCNGLTECDDGSDEDCSHGTLSNILLGATTGGVLILYLCFKIFKMIFFIFKKVHPQVVKQTDSDMDMIFNNVRVNHNDSAAFEALNNYLLHTINSQMEEKTKAMCKQFYAMEAEFHNSNESEIFCCLHGRVNPIVMKEVYWVAYPDFITRSVDKIKIFTIIHNKLIECEWFLQLISFLRRILKIELNVLDVFKDVFLAISILTIIGGPQAIWQFPTNFSSIIAIISLGTIILPMALVAIQMMIMDPWATLPFQKKLCRRPLMTAISLLFSGITPILLLNTFQERKEEVRKAAKRNQENISEKWQQYKKAKGYFVEYLKIELGTRTSMMHHFLKYTLI